jgi:hypothetical protein
VAVNGIVAAALTSSAAGDAVAGYAPDGAVAAEGAGIPACEAGTAGGGRGIPATVTPEAASLTGEAGACGVAVAAFAGRGTNPACG